MTLPTGLSWQDFLDLPDDPLYRHAELINGEVVLNPPTSLHQQVVARLVFAIEQWIRAGTDRGELTMDPPVKITDNRGYLPDVAWYPQERCAPAGQPPAFDGAPALVAEVLSPSTRSIDAVRKRGDYPRVGVDELWLVDPEVPAALVLRRAGSAGEFELVKEVDREGRLSSPLLPGLTIRLGDLLER